MRTEILHIPCRGGHLEVELTGAGPDLLLLHGLSANRRCWDRVVALLRDRFRCIVPDLLGRGASPAEDGARFRLSDEVSRLRRLAAALELRDLFVAGHSQGAAVSLAWAAAAGGSSRLLLANPVTPWTRPPALLRALPLRALAPVAAPALRRLRRPLVRWTLERRVLAGSERAPPEMVERYARPYARPDGARTILRVLADWEPAELAARLPAAGARARVLAGARDRRIPVADARRLADRLGAPCREIEGAGHAIPEEAPETVAEELLALQLGP